MRAQNRASSGNGFETKRDWLRGNFPSRGNFRGGLCSRGPGGEGTRLDELLHRAERAGRGGTENNDKQSAIRGNQLSGTKGSWRGYGMHGVQRRKLKLISPALKFDTALIVLSYCS